MKLKKIGLRKGGVRLTTEKERDVIARKIQKDMKAFGKKTLGG